MGVLTLYTIQGFCVRISEQREYDNHTTFKGTAMRHTAPDIGLLYKDMSLKILNFESMCKPEGKKSRNFEIRGR